MLVSKCCNSISWNDSNVCAECMEHSEFVKYKEEKSEQENLRSN